MAHQKTYGDWLKTQNSISFHGFKHAGESYVFVNDGTYCWATTKAEWDAAKACKLDIYRDHQETYTDFCGLCSYQPEYREAYEAEYDATWTWA